MEIWKTITEHRNYSISSYGNLKNVKTGRVRKFRLTYDGYCKVNLPHGHTARVHRIVARAFLGGPPNDNIQVNHIDGNKLNNHIDNLEYCTQAQNARHARSIGLGAVGERHGMAKLKVRQVQAIRRASMDGISNDKLAALCMMSVAQIRRIIKRTAWVSVG